MSSAERTLNPATVGWRGRAGAYLALARISNSPTVVSDVLAGAALASAAAPASRVAPVALAMVLFYTAGMFLNDLCDLAVDRRERPERPLPSGLLAPRSAALAVVALFAAANGILLGIGLRAFAAGLVLTAVIVAYDLWHKGNPYGPVIMGATRALVYVTAFLAVSNAVSTELLVAAGLLWLYVTALTSIAKREHGLLVLRRWPVAAVLAPAAWYGPQLEAAVLVPVLLLFLGWSAYALSFAYAPGRSEIGGAVRRLIAGISLFDALVLSTSVGASALTGLALAAFGLTALLQRHIEGT